MGTGRWRSILRQVSSSSAPCSLVAVLVTGQLPSPVPQPEQTPGHLEVTSFSTCVTVLQYVVALTDPGDLAS